jgi:hypothetical protein
MSDNIKLLKKQYRLSLGKKVKEFTIEERRTYDNIGYSSKKARQYYDKNISQIRNRSRKNYHEGEGKEKAKPPYRMVNFVYLFVDIFTMHRL